MGSTPRWEGRCGTFERPPSFVSILPTLCPCSALSRAWAFCLACTPPNAYVSWHHGWQAPVGAALKGHLWAEQMRTEGTDLDVVLGCARPESEGNLCPRQSQEVAEASQMNTLGASGLQTALEIFTNAKSTCYITGKLTLEPSFL